MKTTRDSYQGIGASHALKALRTADLIRWVAANKPGMTVDTTEDAPESWANMLWTIEDGEDRVCMIRAVDISKRSYRNASYGSEVVWVAHGEFFPQRQRKFSWTCNYVRRDRFDDLLEASFPYIRGINAKEIDAEQVGAAVNRMTKPCEWLHLSNWQLREWLLALLDKPDDLAEGIKQHEVKQELMDTVMTMAANQAISEVLWDAHNRKFQGV